VIVARSLSAGTRAHRLSMSRPILYITFDGVLQPLAFSQVVRVVTALARRGFVYHLLSVERTRDLAETANVERVRRVLAEAGVTWTAVGVDLTGSVRQSATAFARTVGAALSMVRRHDVALIHARAYQSCAVASVVRQFTGVPFLFDARGCWIDERPDWFAHPVAYAAGKLAERRLYSDAKAVVTLTQLHARDVVDGAFGTKDPNVVVTIPTCADYDEFRLARDSAGKRVDTSVVPSEVECRLSGRIVLGIVGSLNRSYLPQPTLSLVSYVCALRTDAHLLVLTEQQREYADLLAARGLASDRFTLAFARHDDMPSWLRAMDWGFLLLSDTISKHGSMPTKLAEFFAAGVRPLAYGCNSEMVDWVRRAASGIVLDTIDDVALQRTAQSIATWTYNADDLQRARDATAPHFSLRSGVERYATLLHRIIETR
jgi:hypothetical protein